MADIRMPKLSDTMTEGTLVAWKKKPGDTVSMGEVIAEVETDKATMEMEAFEDGVLTEIFVKEGQKVAIGERIARIGGDAGGAGEAPAATEEKGAAAPEKQKPADTTAPATAKSSSDAPQAPRGAAPSPESPAADGARVKASPLARKLATEHGVNLTGLHGSGPGGRIIQRDVLAAAQSGGAAAKTQPAAGQAKSSAAASQPPTTPAPVAAAQPKALAQDPKTPLSSMRKTIADRLLQSKTTIPHFYLHI
ncbi:MAG: E3 binding domain-containing protein, partial [Verrucomicrobia bacterium]|nr:E3 binding domain-containing protein [Verrucomicrobiota bacterium]